MSRKIWKPRRAMSALLALGALAATGLAATLEAQQVRPRVRVEADDCRCVDKEGRPVERCTCVVMPDVDRIVTTALAGIRGRARLGVTLSAEASDAQGAVVSSVLEDGPAARAGIREGDVITRLDGKSLLEPLGPDTERDFDADGPLAIQRLMAMVREIEPGEEVSVEFLRDGQRQTVTLEAQDLDPWSHAMDITGPRGEVMIRGMGDLRDRVRELRLHAPEAPRFRVWSDSAAPPRSWAPALPEAGTSFFRSDTDDVLRACPGGSSARGWTVFAGGGCIGGLQLVELNPGLGDYFGATKGVLVADVHEDSKLGLRPGDVIVDVGGREATDPERVRRILASYGPDEDVALRVVRQKREMSVQGTLGR